MFKNYDDEQEDDDDNDDADEELEDILGLYCRYILLYKLLMFILYI